MKSIVSVFARDRKGIIAYVTNLLAEKDINVLDISQTVLQEYFTMIMLVDAAACSVPFAELVRLLKDAGEEMGMQIRAQREEVFDAMYKI